MGIMYKLMKHRNPSMDVSKEKPLTKIKSDKCRLITIEGNIIESTNSTATNQQFSDEDSATKDMELDTDKQFTAEHILQLCKFLAEKSKRNKNLYKQQQSPKKLNKSKQTEFSFQQMDYDDNDEVDYYQNEALPLINPQRLEQQQHQQKDEQQQQCHQNNLSVLSTRLSPDINSLNITSSSATSCALQHHQQQQQSQQQQHHQQQNQGKRDILLKIRNQIFERKRLREKGGFEHQVLNSSQVWRPW